MGACAASSAEEQVERQLQLKELRIGRRAIELAAWSGEGSLPQCENKGGLSQVSMRLLLEGNEEDEANVSVVKEDLSEHETLLEVPEELWCFNEHVGELRACHPHSERCRHGWASCRICRRCICVLAPG